MEKKKKKKAKRKRRKYAELQDDSCYASKFNNALFFSVPTELLYLLTTTNSPHRLIIR